MNDSILPATPPGMTPFPMWRSRLRPPFNPIFAALAATTLMASGVCLAAHETPYVPARDDIVLQTVPSMTDPRVRAFDALRVDQQQHPQDLARAIVLARAYLGYGRSTGDARYLGRAAAVIAPWLQQHSVPVEVQMLQATLLQSRHFFDESRTLLQDIVKLDPTNNQAWLTLATVAQVQGDMTAARRACAHLFGTSNALIPGGCLSSLNAVDGHVDTAWQTLSLLLPQLSGATPDQQSWIHGVMADVAVIRADPDAADLHFRAALQAAPGDNFVLADYGDFLLDQNRAADALTLVKGYSASDTSFLRQVFAELALNSPQAQADKEQMAQRWAAIDARGERTYGREEAMFALHAEHDVTRALKIAEQNWKVQRAPKDARILLEAALAAGQPASAQPVLQLVTDTQLQDPVVLKLVARVNAAMGKPPSAAGATSPAPIAQPSSAPLQQPQAPARSIQR